MRRVQGILSLLATALCIFLSSGGAFAQASAATASPGQATPVPQPSPADGSKLVIPAETIIPMVLRNTINSRTARVGQGIYCETIFPVTVGNRIVIPVGSSVKGSVTQVVRPGHGKKRAQIGLRFETLVLPNGTTRPLRGVLSGFGGTGAEEFNTKESKVQGPSSKGEDAGKVVQTTITGAEIGTIVGAAERSPVTGLGVGSLAGAAGGAVWVMSRRGKEVVLPSGTSLELQLASPLSFEREEVEPPSRYEQGPTLPRPGPTEAGPG